MCVAFPAEILSIDGAEAEVSIGGARRRASIILTPEARVGDFVLLHAGFAIRVLDLAEAKATIALLKDISAANG
jgi:hydrogenase expression/formation protein HypC